jgi:hypothetical protein
MAKAKTWTAEDREFALDWIERKGRTGSILREQESSIDELLTTLNAINDAQAFADHLCNEVKDDAWRRLLSAIRQRKCSVNRKESSGQPAHDNDNKANANARCESCEQFKLDIENLRRENAELLEQLSRNPARMQKDVKNYLRGLTHADSQHHPSNPHNPLSQALREKAKQDGTELATEKRIQDLGKLATKAFIWITQKA